MAFDPQGQLAEADRNRAVLSELMAEAVRDLDLAREDLQRQIEEHRREQAETRVTGTAEGDAVRVVVDGTTTVQRIDLAERWYAAAAADQVGAAVLAALKMADGPDADDAEPPGREPTGIPALDDLEQRYRALRARLGKARVKAAAPSGDVDVVVDGHGRPVRVTVEFAGDQRPSVALLGERLATVARSAQQAAAELRERTHQEARMEARATAGMPLDLPDGAGAVAQAFGTIR